MALAISLGTNYRRLKNLLCLYGLTSPVSPIADYNQWLRGEPKGCLVIADPHIPMHDEEFLGNCVGLAEAWKAPLSLCIVLGDALDMSAFTPFINPPTQTFGQEKHIGIQFFAWLCKWFDEVWWIAGNHDQRLIKYLKEQLDMEDMKALMGNPAKLRVSDYNWCELGPDWRLEHPRSASVIPGRVPSRMANIFSNKHIVGGHGHLRADTVADDGLRYAIDIGVTCCQEKMDYIMLKHSIRPRIVKGAIILMHKDTQLSLPSPMGIQSTYVPYVLKPESDFLAMRRMYQ